MKVAVAKYPIKAPASWAEFAARQRTVLAEAADAGAQLAVLPEYLSLELAAALGPDVSKSLPASLRGIQAFHDDWLALYDELAQSLNLIIQAGTFLLQVDGGRYRNRAWWFTPEGRRGYQDKMQLTGFEKQLGVIDAGDALQVFDLGGVRTGIAVCYDSEFPLSVRAQREAGAQLLLVPSCTDTDAGSTRVTVGCMARALENRMFVAKAVTAGEAAWSPALDVNTGEAVLYAPMDRGFPADGVLASTHGDQLWAMADLDFDALASRLGEAQVTVDGDWSQQRQQVTIS